MPQENDVRILLRMWMERTGKTQGTIAKSLGMSIDGYKKWLQGNLPYKRIPDAVRVLKLSEEEEALLYEAVQRMAPRKYHLPSQNSLFTGREAYMERLDQRFKEDNWVALSGLGGIGKTQLALEYAYRRFKDKTYRAAFWVNAADQTTIGSSCRDLAKELDLPERDEHKEERVIRAVRQWFAEHTNWLLVMDNADDLQLAKSFVLSVGQGDILLTTRSQFVGKIGARQIDVEKMALTEGIAFLLRRSGTIEGVTSPKKVAEIREVATQLAQMLDGHPLALDQAGAFIYEAQVSIATYIQLYEVQRRDLLDSHGAIQEPDAKHPETVVVTFELCFQKARERYPLAENILRFCAPLHPDTIPRVLFQHDETFGADVLAFNRGIAALRRYSLIKRDRQKQIFSMHRLVQAVIVDSMPPDLQQQYRARVVSTLAHVMIHSATPPSDPKNWWWSEMALPHIVACAAWSEDELPPTVEFARLLYTTAAYLLLRGRRAESEPLFERSLPILKQHLGREHPDTVDVMAQLAIIYLPHKKEQAKLLREEVLSIYEKTLDPEHPESAKTLYLLAEKYRLDHKIQAKFLLERALAIQEKTLDPEHIDIAESLESLAILLISPTEVEQADSLLPRTKMEQAEALLLRALAIFEKHLGTEHPRLILLLYRLVFVLYVEDLLHIEGKRELLEVVFERASSLEQRVHAIYFSREIPKKTFADYLHEFQIETLADEMAYWDELESAHKAGEDVSEKLKYLPNYPTHSDPLSEL